jgi:hypothetical protein
MLALVEIPAAAGDLARHARYDGRHVRQCERYQLEPGRPRAP